MIDIHCHMLPGVDDGSGSMETSLLMAQDAVRGGTDVVIVTPHCNIPGAQSNYQSAELLRQFFALRAAIDNAGIPLKILAGAEIFCTEDTPELFKEKKLLTLASSCYMLVEFSFDESIINIDRKLTRLAALGIKPVIAHPERYEAVHRNPQLCIDWFELGYVLQINKDSVFGLLGRHAQKCSKWMLAHGLAHAAASDAHGTVSRTADLSTFREYVEAEHSADYAQILLYENPRRIIKGLPMVRP